MDNQFGFNSSAGNAISERWQDNQYQAHWSEMIDSNTSSLGVDSGSAMEEPLRAGPPRKHSIKPGLSINITTCFLSQALEIQQTSKAPTASSWKYHIQRKVFSFSLW